MGKHNKIQKYKNNNLYDVNTHIKAIEYENRGDKLIAQSFCIYIIGYFIWSFLNIFY